MQRVSSILVRKGQEDANANVTCNVEISAKKAGRKTRATNIPHFLTLPRVRKELIEDAQLSPYASRASQSRGRVLPEPECPVRTVYERDVGRILYSMPFRRLRHKTQVFSIRKTTTSAHAWNTCSTSAIWRKRSEAASVLIRR